jgi:hypothetical protein
MQFRRPLQGRAEISIIGLSWRLLVVASRRVSTLRVFKPIPPPRQSLLKFGEQVPDFWVSYLMATEEIEICCFSCNGSTGITRNEWARWNVSHIAPVQKPWYTATRIDEERSIWQHRPDVLELTQITASKASCTECGELLGQYCRSARGADAESMKYVVLAAADVKWTNIWLESIFSMTKQPYI